MNRSRLTVPEERRAYRVAPELLEYGLADPSHTPIHSCTGHCCKSGVFLSLPHRELILQHVEVIRGAMDDVQPADPSKWFEQPVEKDEDFEGGYAVGTEATEHGCVFLNRAGRCVLQIVSAQHPELPQLKPFFCRLFPLTVVDGELTYDDHCEGETLCCSVEEDGAAPLLDVCEYEFLVAIDRSELEALRAQAGRNGKPKQESSAAVRRARPQA